MADAGRLVLCMALATLVIGVWAAGLARLDLFTSADLRAWRRLATLRGFSAPMGRLERAAARAPWLRRLQDELDLHRQLAIAGWSETPSGFLLRTVAVSLLSIALFIGLLVVGLLETGSWPFPPWGALMVGALAILVQVQLLRSQANLRRDQAGQALGDMMMVVAIITDGRGLQVGDAIRILSRCVHHRALEEIVDRRGWRRLVREPTPTTIELYRAIDSEFRIPQFTVVADAAANANVGFSEREIYSRVATAFYAQRLAEARFRAARAKTLVTLPVAGMLIPLLILIGAPVFAVISGGLSGG
ncbi:MAG: hypothetical protein WCB85_06450 [Candidatus Dormiibacterota bacterium]